VNWSAINTRSLAGRAVRLPARLIPRTMMVPIRRGPAKGLRWIVGANTHGCWLGTYELEKQRALMRFVREGMTIYDVGRRPDSTRYSFRSWSDYRAASTLSNPVHWEAATGSSISGSIDSKMSRSYRSR
jgi:hypothetical protein